MKVCIWGLGEIGTHWLNMLVHRAQNWETGKGYDINPKRVEQLKAEYPDFDITNDPEEALKDVDTVVICVPTGIVNNEPDLSAVYDSADAIIQHAKDKLIILESTVPIGTTEKIFNRKPYQYGDAESLVLHTTNHGYPFKCVAYSPERTNPGHDEGPIPRLYCGLTDAATQRCAKFLDECGIPAIKTPSVEVAEAAKLMENAFRFINIAWAIELEGILKDQGLDYCEVLEAAQTKPFGFMPFTPSLGAGGHCIPITPFFLGKHEALLRAQEINDHRPYEIAARIQKRKKPPAKINIYRVGYKLEVPALTNSPSIKLKGILEHMGYDIEVVDAYKDDSIRVCDILIRQDEITYY